MPRRRRNQRRNVDWCPELTNCLHRPSQWLERPGYREWLERAYRTHRRQILARDYFAAAVVAFESDPALVARAKDAVEAQWREFEERYGHLRVTDA